MCHSAHTEVSGQRSGVSSVLSCGSQDRTGGGGAGLDPSASTISLASYMIFVLRFDCQITPKIS